MSYLESRLFCRLDGLSPQAREQKRLTAITELGIAADDNVLIFTEATQSAAQFLEAPICWLSIFEPEYQRIKASFGLSRMGFMNDLTVSRQIPREESFCTYVVDSQQVLAIPDTFASPVFTHTLLVQHYGIRAYLGAPLTTAQGICIGSLAVMDLVPRQFTQKDVDFLELMARWSLSEFERSQLLKKQYPIPPAIAKNPADSSENSPFWLPPFSPSHRESQGAKIPETKQDFTPPSVNPLKVKLLSQLAQELRTPLTSVMGMASVLGREVYGPLTAKQKEYLEIIHHSGQHLVSLVDEILELGVLEETHQKLDLCSIDIEMLCQQAINGLTRMAQLRQQQIQLSVEPGKRIWSVDKDKVRQIIYYLILSMIQTASEGSIVRIHVSRKSEALVSHGGDRLQIAFWVTHPWLGDGLPQVDILSYFDFHGVTNGTDLGQLLSSKFNSLRWQREALDGNSSESPLSFTPNSHLGSSTLTVSQPIQSHHTSREALGLLLSCQLADLHQGQIWIQGSPEVGYRCVLSLPQLTSEESLVE